MPTATVYIHGGDYDCSEAVRMCYRAVGVLPYGSYMWTGNEIELLTAHGFKVRSLSSPKVGDVLWREGHTEMYLGDNMQGGARIAETGGINGAKGDQTGREITRSAYKPSSWSKLMRYEGGATVDGIPCAIAAAKVMDHIIDHSAHGYSQPNRAGDGTIEKVTITYGGGKTPAQTVPKLPVKVTFKQRTDVMDFPSTKTGAAVAHYLRGETCTISGLVLNDGHVWGTYTGGTSGRTRYVDLGTTELVTVA